MKTVHKTLCSLLLAATCGALSLQATAESGVSIAGSGGMPSRIDIPRVLPDGARGPSGMVPGGMGSSINMPRLDMPRIQPMPDRAGNPSSNMPRPDMPRIFPIPNGGANRPDQPIVCVTTPCEPAGGMPPVIKLPRGERPELPLPCNDVAVPCGPSTPGVRPPMQPPVKPIEPPRVCSNGAAEIGCGPSNPSVPGHPGIRPPMPIKPPVKPIEPPSVCNGVAVPCGPSTPTNPGHPGIRPPVIKPITPPNGGTGPEPLPPVCDSKDCGVIIMPKGGLGGANGMERRPD